MSSRSAAYPPPKDHIAVESIVQLATKLLSRLTSKLPPDTPISRVSVIATNFTEITRQKRTLTAFLPVKEQESDQRKRPSPCTHPDGSTSRENSQEEAFSDLCEASVELDFDPFAGLK